MSRRDIKFRKLPKIRAEIALLFLAFFSLGAVSAAPIDAATGPFSQKPLPRYESLRDELVYMRIGPGWDYRVRWELRRADLPVRIFGEYGEWRRVRLHDEAEGWIHRSMLRDRRFATAVEADAVIRSEPGLDGERLAIAKPALPLRLRKCGRHWCFVEVGDVRGWTRKSEIWGVDRDEILK